MGHTSYGEAHSAVAKAGSDAGPGWYPHFSEYILASAALLLIVHCAGHNSKEFVA